MTSKTQSWVTIVQIDTYNFLGISSYSLFVTKYNFRGA